MTKQKIIVQTKLPLDKAKLRYAIYVRKSTEEGNRQVNSIEDQIALCQEYATRNGLNVVLPPITEHKSARYATNFQDKPERQQRPRFAELVEKIEAGEIDGIIAYHPDRLARNMLDAGVILDMLTPRKGEAEPVLKDLAFTSISYSNDSGGRLTLAVLFSLATQYSEHLSEQVHRGIDHNLLKRGQSVGTPKWGYVHQNGKYVPDENFELVEKGWRMILEGGFPQQVLDYWTMHDMKRLTKPDKDGNQNVKRPSKDTPGKIFRDSFYFGRLIQTGIAVELAETQPDFRAMITEEEYNRVQERLDSRYQTHRHEKPSEIIIPFQNMLICDTCKNKMYIGASGHKGGKKYVTAYCQCKACDRAKIVKGTPGLTVGVRVKDILEPVYNFLDNLVLDESAYDEYSANIDKNLDAELEELRMEKASLNGIRAQKENRLRQEHKKYSNLASRDSVPESVFKAADERIAELESAIDDIENRIQEINFLLKNPEILKLSKEDFLNFLSTSGKRLRNASFAAKDEILKKLILNITINAKNEFFYLLKPEFEGLISVKGFDNFDFGQGDRI